MVTPVTVQTVSSAADLLLIVTGAGLLVLFFAAMVQAVRRRWRSAAALTGIGCVVVAAYGGLLLGFGLTSTPRQLMPGDAKCFDDWCAAMLEARGDGTSLQARVQLQNRGRGRAMRSLLARAYVEGRGAAEIAPVDGGVLQTWLQPGQQVNLELNLSGKRNQGRGTFRRGGRRCGFASRSTRDRWRGKPIPRQGGLVHLRAGEFGALRKRAIRAA